MGGGVTTAYGTGRARGQLLALTGLVLAMALAATGCSSGSVASSATSPSSTRPDSTIPGGHTGGGSTGVETSPQHSAVTGDSGSIDPPSANGSSGAGSKVSGPTARDGGSKGGSATPGRGRGGSSPTADTTGLPPLKQQFAVDDAAFRSAMASVQKDVAKGSATSTRQQLAQALFPLLAAANAYQSQLVNLPFSSSVKPLVQVLTERLGQLTAELEQIQQPGAFFSASAVGAAVSSAEAAVRSASNAVRTQV